MEKINYIENIPVSLTKHLQDKKKNVIKRILDLLDSSDINLDDKKRIRKVVLDEVNEFYLDVCRVLTVIQEKG